MFYSITIDGQEIEGEAEVKLTSRGAPATLIDPAEDPEIEIRSVTITEGEASTDAVLEALEADDTFMADALTDALEEAAADYEAAQEWRAECARDDKLTERD